MKFKVFSLLSILLFSISSHSFELEEVQNVLDKSATTLKKDQINNLYWNYSCYQGAHLVSMYYIGLKFMGLESKSQLKSQKLEQVLLETQNQDGYWYTTFDKKFSKIIHSQSDFDSTVLNYFALKLMGHSTNSKYMTKARDFIKTNGGLEKADLQVLTILALTGNAPWSMIPKISSLILNHYSPVSMKGFATWITTSLPATSYLRSIKAARNLSYKGTVVTIDELWNDKKIINELRANQVTTNSKISLSQNNKSRVVSFSWIEEILKAYETSTHGSIKGDTINTLISMITMNTFVKYEKKNLQNNPQYKYLIGVEKDLTKKGIVYIDSLYINNERKENNYKGISSDGRYWDTILASLALLDAGENLNQFLDSAQYLASVQNKKNGGVGYGHGYENIPDTDDTAAAILLWSKFGNRFRKNIKKAAIYIMKMQNHDNGFATFSQNKDGNMLADLAVRSEEKQNKLFDKSSSDITAHAVEALVIAQSYFPEYKEDISDTLDETGPFDLYRYQYDDENKNSELLIDAIKSGFKYLAKNRDFHHQWSYWKGRWSVNYLYGTWSVITAMEAAKKLEQETPEIKSVISWLVARQNKDGGYGETYLSDKNSALAGRGESTPTQTAWALMTLMKLGKTDSSQAKNAVAYLLKSFDKEKQTWDDSNQRMGTGIPNHTYIMYPGYPKTFTVMALARYLQLVKQK
jgi:squalene-hopene/tetraprenyl-beta-curcumene cyclase